MTDHRKCKVSDAISGRRRFWKGSLKLVSVRSSIGRDKLGRTSHFRRLLSIVVRLTM